MRATHTLRLTQKTLPGGQHHVLIDLDGAGMPQSAATEFAFTLSAQEREDLRWYLEDYLQYPIDPAPVIAQRVERRMRALGGELYTQLFDTNPAARRLWARLEPDLASTRVEVASEVDADAVLPWELIHDPYSNTDLALYAHSFVRAQRQTARPARLPKIDAGETIRVLLVICRPGGRRDVPFRSVGRHLVGLSAQAREVFHLDVLRPPTFVQLARVLRQAAARGKPYHVVHFDGHGTWTHLPNVGQLSAQGGGGGHGPWHPSRYAARDPRPGPHGYLLFEHPATVDNSEHVDGLQLGNLLAETMVPVLVLNACRSAHADLATAPQDVVTTPMELQTRVRAYGSLAQEVVDAGIAGVVAMRYSVYVDTASRFITDLYRALLEGLPLGQAVTIGRKQLFAEPDREIAFIARPLQDWVVPVVYEAAPLELFSKPRDGERLSIKQGEAQAANQEGRPLDASLPERPDVGFYGRDETLLALDRAFDTQPVVLLFGYAGAGKTTTAAEFARWYQVTGGVRGPVLFTSFEQHASLARVLDQLGEVFEPTLEAQGIHWLALTDQRRREVALQLLEQVPLLWIWDNVELVSGFPAGTSSQWTTAEQAELRAFLRTLPATKARMLLTSRRDERAWLGNLPRRLMLPPMPMAERVRLARAIADRNGHHLNEVEDWRPLLDYAQGNPLTITVLVGQALRDGIRTRQQVDGFVGRLRSGEARLEDDQREGRTRSLGASLAYGFGRTFTETERAQLAVLSLFQGMVDVDALRWMGDPRAVETSVVPALAGMTREAGIALLDRAAEIGLLDPLGGGHYRIHPVLPWYFADLFSEYHGPPDSPGARAVRHAYACALAQLGSSYMAGLLCRGSHNGDSDAHGRGV